MLEDEYHYETTEITLREDDNPQQYFNNVLTPWVRENCKEHALCIIYYTGHGWTDNNRGNLSLTRYAR